MDKLFRLEELSYRIAMYMLFFALGIQLAVYLVEKHAGEIGTDTIHTVFVPSPCKECIEKRREMEKHHNG